MDVTQNEDIDLFKIYTHNQDTLHGPSSTHAYFSTMITKAIRQRLGKGWPEVRLSSQLH